MPTSITVINNTSSGVGTTQPTTPGLWINSGVLTYWNGVQNNVVDFDSGPVTDAFGVDTGIDI